MHETTVLSKQLLKGSLSFHEYSSLQNKVKYKIAMHQPRLTVQASTIHLFC